MSLVARRRFLSLSGGALAAAAVGITACGSASGSGSKSGVGSGSATNASSPTGGLLAGVAIEARRDPG